MDEATSGLIICLALLIPLVVSALVFLMAKTARTARVSDAIQQALVWTILASVLSKLATGSNLATSVVGPITFCIAVFVAHQYQLSYYGHENKLDPIMKKIFGVKLVFD